MPDRGVLLSRFMSMTEHGPLLRIISGIDAEYRADTGLDREKFIEFSFGLLSGVPGAAGRVPLTDCDE